MDEAVSIWQKVTNLGSAAALFAILWASYKGVWRWAKDTDKELAAERQLRLEERARYEAMLEAERVDKREWKAMALQGRAMAQLGLEATKEVVKS